MPDAHVSRTLAPVDNKITALAGISNQALASGTLPPRLKIFNWGANPSDKGVYQVTAASAAALRQQIAGKSYARILLDFEHNSLKGHPNYQPAPRKHAGMGDLEVVDNDGVYLSAIEYTPAGKEYARENSDLSPAAVFDKDGTLLAVLSCALLPNGSLDNVTFFSAAVPQGEATNPTKDTDMADIVALEASVLTLTKENEKLRTDLTALSAKIPDAAKHTALETTVTALSAKIVALETADLQRAKDALLVGATQAGKLVALEADVIGQMTVAQLTTHIGKLPIVVPLSARTPRIVKPDGVAGTDLLAQLNAIKDPAARMKFYADNKAKLS
jgi:hypothetical protein